MVITIDGPAGTGKSTAALLVAQQLKFDFLDTGAMYRAIGLAALRREVDLNDPRALAFEAKHAKIEFDWSKMPPGVMLNGEPVGHLLRGVEATRAASYVAAVPAIREMLVEQQRKIGSERKNVVTEGRDQGTVVFPGAGHKFYLDASPAERAGEDGAELRSRGETVDFHQILSEIENRDLRDRSRTVGPLAVPKDAETVDTTSMSQEEVVQYIVGRIEGNAPMAPAVGARVEGT